MNHCFSLPAVCTAVVCLGLLGCSNKKPTDNAAPGVAASASANAPANVSPNAAPGVTAPASGASAPTPAGPPVSVSTAKAEARDMAVSLKTTGTVFPLASVDIKAQTNSVVTKMHINGGQFVRAGDPLFTLDARAE